MRQLSLTLEHSLLQQFPDFRDVVRASVYACGRPFKLIAADLDMSLSELSRKLSENVSDPVHFPLTRLPDRCARPAIPGRLCGWSKPFSTIHPPGVITRWIVSINCCQR